MELLLQSIEELKNKDSVFYFVGFNPTNMPNASSIYTYDVALYLKNKGYNVKVMFDKNFVKPYWISQAAKDIEHIEEHKVKIKPSDFLFLPEILVTPFFKDLEKEKVRLSCEIVVISQTYSHIFKTMENGLNWTNYKIRHAITTSEKQKRHIQEYMPRVNVEVINPQIPEFFHKPEKPALPRVVMLGRDATEMEDIQKKFQTKYPYYRWIDIRYMAHMSHEEMADAMKNSVLAVWVDPMSSFGTFPLEAMRCGVPVIAQLPEMIPEWAEETVKDEQSGKDVTKLISNVVWFSTKEELVDALSGALNQFFSDTIPSELYDNMSKLDNRYTKESFDSQADLAFQSIIDSRIVFLENSKKMIEQKQLENA